MHGVVVHKGSVTLQVELAQGENSQRNEGDGENQTQQGVWSTTTFCNTDGMEGGERRGAETRWNISYEKERINFSLQKCFISDVRVTMVNQTSL